MKNTSRLALPLLFSRFNFFPSNVQRENKIGHHRESKNKPSIQQGIKKKTQTIALNWNVKKSRKI